MQGEDIHQPNDKLFKAGFSDPANTAAFLQTQLPTTIAAQIDWAQLRLVPGSFIDSHFRHSESDLLFSSTIGGSSCLIHILFEHQTTPEPRLALRLLRYMIRIWEASLKEASPPNRLPIILPVVLAQNAEVWRIQNQFSSLLDLPASASPDLITALSSYIPDFQFLLIQLAAMPFEEIRGTPAGILILRAMKAERVKQLLSSSVWDESLLVKVPPETFEQLLRYIMGADIDKDSFETNIQRIQNLETRRHAMTLAQRYHDEGLHEGHREGSILALRQSVIEALTIRLGPVPEGLGEAISEINDAERLRTLHRSAIQSSTLEEFTETL